MLSESCGPWVSCRKWEAPFTWKKNKENIQVIPSSDLWTLNKNVISKYDLNLFSVAKICFQDLLRRATAVVTKTRDLLTDDSNLL
jgi:hypothetical protein